MRELRIALRDWDWLTPLLLHEVPQTPLERLGVRLAVDRVDALPDPWGPEPQHGAYETSLSRYHRAVVSGDDRIVAVPHMLMQSFRHRCIIVARDSDAKTAADLRGACIGLTGWVDSGNTWTRDVLAGEGVGIEDARWVAGRLTEAHPETDRLDGFGRPGRIEAAPAGSWMTAMLDSGQLDAVLTPFMPPGFYAPDAPWRSLYADIRGAETAYADRWGFVPAHHVLSFPRAGFDPEVARAVGEVLLASRAEWLRKRRKYADTSMWLGQDLHEEAVRLPAGWDAPGLAAQRAMVERFTAIQHEQGITTRAATVREMFPFEEE